MKYLRLRQATVPLSEEAYTKLEQLTAWYNEWSAQQEEFKNEAPLSVESFFLACLPRLIATEYEQAKRLRGEQ